MTQQVRIGSGVDLRAIDRIRDAHVAALNAGDGGAWAAQFADDGVQMPPNAPANVGMTMIRSWSQGMLDQFRVQFALAVDEVRILDDWAFVSGAYIIGLDARNAGGPQMQVAGKYISLFQRKSADTWRIARDIWNSSNPPPGM
jgi:uncharacterized protein (TIGR02246 family)